MKYNLTTTYNNDINKIYYQKLNKQQQQKHDQLISQNINETFQ